MFQYEKGWLASCLKSSVRRIYLDIYNNYTVNKRNMHGVCTDVELGQPDTCQPEIWVSGTGTICHYDSAFWITPPYLGSLQCLYLRMLMSRRLYLSSCGFLRHCNGPLTRAVIPFQTLFWLGRPKNNFILWEKRIERRSKYRENIIECWKQNQCVQGPLLLLVFVSHVVLNLVSVVPTNAKHKNHCFVFQYDWYRSPSNLSKHGDCGRHS